MDTMELRTGQMNKREQPALFKWDHTEPSVEQLKCGYIIQKLKKTRENRNSILCVIRAIAHLGVKPFHFSDWLTKDTTSVPRAKAERLGCANSQVPTVLQYSLWLGCQVPPNTCGNSAVQSCAPMGTASPTSDYHSLGTKCTCAPCSYDSRVSHPLSLSHFRSSGRRNQPTTETNDVIDVRG